MTAPQRLADALQRTRNADAEQHSTQATVTAVQATTVTVSIAGVESTWPFLASSYTPSLGDVVWCVGPPGSWVVIGSVSGAGPARATTQTVTAGQTVSGGSTVNGDQTVTGRQYADNYCVTGNSIWSYNKDGAIRWSTSGSKENALEIVTRAGDAYRDCWANGFGDSLGTNVRYGYSSWRALKEDHETVAEYLGHSALDEVMGLDISAWRYRPGLEIGDNRKRVGLHLDELHPKLRRENVIDDVDRSTWDTSEMMNVALAAVQDLSAVLAAQQKALARLTERLDALEGTG